MKRFIYFIRLKTRGLNPLLFIFMTGLFFAGCDHDGETASLFETPSSVKVTVTGLDALDGSELEAYAFGQAAYFYPPDSAAHGRAKIKNGQATAELSPSLRDGSFFAYAYVDLAPDDGNRPMPGDLFAGPANLTVSGGSGNVKLSPGDFVPVNVLAQVDYADPTGESAEVRVRVGAPGTPCLSETSIEAFGTIEDGRALMGLAGLPDGTYSVCGVIDLDDALPVTSLPGGDDLVAALGAGLVVADGTGAAVLPEGSFHLVPELSINLPTAPDGTQVIVSVVDPASQMPQAFGMGEFQGGSALAPLVFWLLDGNWLAIATIDTDGSGPTGITLGDIFGAVFVNVNGATVLPPIQEGDFITVNVLVTIELDGHDGETVLLGIYPDGSSCTGMPLMMGMPMVLAGGSATIHTGGLPDGNYEACPVVDVDASGGPTSGDLTAIHPFSLSGAAQFTIVEGEFFPIP